MSNDLHFESQAKADEYLLDHQITSYKAEARTTRSRAKHLRELEQRRAALHAPVNKLPDELLSEVFLAGAEDPDPYPLVDINFSLIVSWVGSRWRRVALNTPRLWLSLEITVPESVSQRERWTTFLTRSRATTQLLDLEIVLTPGQPLFPLDYEPLKLAECLTRCEALAVACADVDRRAVIGPPSNALTSPQPILSIVLSDVKFRSIDSFLDLLRMFPRLLSLTLNSTDLDDTELLSGELPVFLDQLAELTLNNVRIGNELDTRGYLYCFYTEWLEELSILRADPVDIDSTTDFSELTSVSLSQLSPISAEELIEIIRIMPVLEVLKLDLIIHDDIAADTTGVFVPPLIEIDFADSLDVDNFARWIIERTSSDRPPGTLKTISVHRDDEWWRCPISQSTQDLMQEKGIELVIDTAPSVL